MNLNQFMDNLKAFSSITTKDAYGGKYVCSSRLIHILKKNTFRIELRSTVPYDSKNPDFVDARMSAKTFEKTKFGSYKHVGSASGALVILDIIKNCITWPEVGKTEERFDKNQLLQNVIGRAIIKRIGGLAKVRNLAVDDGDVCVICGHSFKYCSIHQDRVRMKWTQPNGESQSRILQLKYNMLHPFFDPDLLIKSIVKFASKLTSLNSQMSTAWGEIENNWHLEVRNNESK